MFKRLLPILLVVLFAPIAAQAASQGYFGVIPMKISGKPVDCLLVMTRNARSISGGLYALDGKKLVAATFVLGSLDGKGRYTAKSIAPSSGMTVTMAGRIEDKKFLNANGAFVFTTPKKQTCVFTGQIPYIGEGKK